jgi:uncharacterized ParB-like nuclease family protein
MNTNFEISLNGTQNTMAGGYNARLDAVKLFNHAYLRGLIGQLWAKLLHKDANLEILPSLPVDTSHPTSRIVSVPIRMIKGSLGRNSDFDVNFNPLTEKSRSRWVSIFSALSMGISIPPVELVQVENAYYVSDGHHRVSVFKALGQEAVDARIVN